jgi:hypothetical protein
MTDVRVERVTLSPEQAIAMLPEGDEVHTFRNSAGMLIGAHHGRAELEQEIRDAERRELAGDLATRMGHGLVLLAKGAKYQSDLLFVATSPENVDGR